MTEVDWEKLSAEVEAVARAMYTARVGDCRNCYEFDELNSEGQHHVFDSLIIEARAAIQALAFPAIKAERDAQAATIRALQEMNDGLRKALGKINAIEDAEYPLEDEYGYESCHVEGYNAGLSKCRETILLALKDTPNAD